MAPESAESEQAARKQRTLIGALLALVAVMAIVLVIALTGHGPLSAKARATSSGISIGVPTAMNERQLRAYAKTAVEPVYWAGPQDGVTYEVTEMADASVFVRYLPSGVPMGDRTSSYLTIGTYYTPGGYASLAQAAQGTQLTSTTMRSGALVVQRNDMPGSTWFSFPDADFQVEVYAPAAGQSFTMVSNGDVAPLN